ncbi:helix-turn-helix transcriptional regulator [Flavobacteriaceae bacterium R38]|nr:helix-turn-helix transcriptional regulator [Flavobacteriaceae bacterium R38]
MQSSNYLASIAAFARTTNKSIYVIDYQKQGFDYVSDNPLFLCGHSAEEVKEMGYEFYFKYVIEQDLNLLLKINQIGFDFYEQRPLSERINLSISYDFKLKNQENKIILVNQKLTPIFLTDDGKIWKAICIVSLSTSKKSGNITVIKNGDNKVFKYNLKDECWNSSTLIELNEREKEILLYSSKGYTINEIANTIHVSPDTVKFHRKKLFEKLEVSNIAEAITYSFNNKII